MNSDYNHVRHDEEVKSAIGSFLDSKPASFYRSGIFALNKRWTNVVEHDGDYCPDNFDKYSFIFVVQ